MHADPRGPRFRPRARGRWRGRSRAGPAGRRRLRCRPRGRRRCRSRLRPGRVEAAVGVEGVAAAEASELPVHEPAALQAHEPPRGADHAHRPRGPSFGVGHAHRQRREARRFGPAESCFGIRGQHVGRRQGLPCSSSTTPPAPASTTAAAIAGARNRPRRHQRRARGRCCAAGPLRRAPYPGSAARPMHPPPPLGARDAPQDRRQDGGGVSAEGRAARRRCSIATKLLMPTPLPPRTGVPVSLRPSARRPAERPLFCALLVVGALRLQGPAQPCPGAMQAHGRGGPRAAHRAGDLRRLEVLPVAQQQSLAIGLREPAEGAARPGRGDRARSSPGEVVAVPRRFGALPDHAGVPAGRLALQAVAQTHPPGAPRR